MKRCGPKVGQENEVEMSRLLTSTSLPVYQGLFEYRIARENLKEFYGVRLFNGRRYDKAVIDTHEIRFYRRDVLRSVIPFIF